MFQQVEQRPSILGVEVGEIGQRDVDATVRSQERSRSTSARA
jgi:hypothetical protein